MPYLARGRFHLSAMCAADYCGQEFCYLHCLLAGKPIDFNLQILRLDLGVIVSGMQRSDESADKILRKKLLDFLCFFFGGRLKRAS
jgi:hypothetical protein